MATGGETENDCSLINVEGVTLQNTNKLPFYDDIVVFSNKIFVIDRNDWKVRIHGLQDGRLLCESDRLEPSPRAFCIINDLEIALILENGLIKIMSTHNTPVIRWARDLRVRGGLDRYDCVVSLNGDLVVYGVKENTLCWCIVSSNDGSVVGTIHQICKVESYLSSSFMTAKHNIIYISCDVMCDTYIQSPDTGVYAYDVQNPSKYKYIYKHKDLKTPTGIDIDQQGSLFVCNYKNPYPCIHHLTSECQLVSIVSQGIPSWPLAIFWDEGLLYLTSYNSNQITRYRTKYPASAGALPSPLTSDTDRFMCIAYLLVDVGSRVLRQLLSHHTVTSTHTLAQYLAQNMNTINSLRRVFNHSQMDIMFPPNGDDTKLDDYDITLLSALFQNIVPTLSQQEKDMIKRLGEERNKLYDHAKSCQISANDFQTYWNDISSTLTTLSQQCRDTAFEAKISQEIQLTKVSVIPAGSYLDILKTWFGKIENVEGVLQNETTRLQALESGDSIIYHNVFDD